jgi:hypothetical protein
MPTVYENKRTGERVWIKRHFQEYQEGGDISCVELSNGQLWSLCAFNHEYSSL